MFLTLWAFLGLVAPLQGHPFDGDGAGAAKEGSHNAQVYLYLEPGSARVECLLWLPAALTRLGLPPEPELLLPLATKQAVESRSMETAPDWCHLKVDGATVRGTLVSSTVLKGMPGRSETLVGADLVPVIDGMLGLIWQYDLPPSFEKVELEWQGFDGTIVKVPVTVFYGPMAESGADMTAAAPSLAWVNQGRLPPEAPLTEVPSLPPQPTFALPLAALVWSLAGGVVLLVSSGGLRKPHQVLTLKTGLGLVIVGAGTASLWPVGTVNLPVPGAKAREVKVEEAREILTSLVENVYRSFDQTGESAIYDVLARSVDGPLLQNLYLQTVQALTLEGQDGTRVKVNDLYVHVDKSEPLGSRSGFIANCQWTARGTVGHWGHLHQRLNRYTARVTVEPVKGSWKMTALEVLEERRL
ncbi:MAG: hypothetical protein ACAI34_09675 [Verrucomicrobium sp.]